MRSQYNHDIIPLKAMINHIMEEYFCFVNEFPRVPSFCLHDIGSVTVYQIDNSRPFRIVVSI